MPNVREYLRNRKEREEKKPRISYREKIKSHRFTIFYRTVLIILLVAAVLAAFYVQWKNKIYTQCSVLSSAELTLPQDTSLMPFSGHLLLYSKDGMSCVDAKGSTVWNETFEMQNPMVDVCRNVTAIGDYNGRNIYVADTSQLLGTITTSKPIRSICVSANGVVGVVLDDVDVTWIYLYSAQGEELVHFRTTMKESGYPVSVSISPSGELVCVSYLFVDSGQMKSSVAFYNFGAVGQNNTDNYVSGYDYLDSVVPVTRFLDNKTLFAVSDDRIMFFSGAQKPVSAAECLLDADVRGVYYGEEYVGLVFNSTESDKRYRLQVYDKSGTQTQVLEFDLDYTDIVFYEEQIIIYNETECCIYNTEGVEKYAGSFEKTALKLIPAGAQYRYMLVTPESIDTVELN